MNTHNNLIDYGDYYGPWQVSFYQTSIGLFVIIAITFFALSAIILLIRLFIIKWSTRAENIAKKKLKKIEQHIKNGNIEIDILYLNLTKVLKEYIQQKYNVNSIGLTDLETLNYLNNLNCSSDLKDLIAILILNAESSKYAFKDVSREKLKLDVINSFLLIENISKVKNIELKH